jgi:hypothetical protein
MKASDQPAKFPVPFGNDAGAGFIRSIPEASQIPITPGAASLTDGFPPLTFQPKASGGVPPFGQDVNGIHFQETALIRWLQAGGLPIYDAAYSTAIGGYPNGAVLVKAAANGFWISTVDDNTTDPDTGGANWNSLVGTDGFLQIANDLSELTATAATARTNISAAKSGANSDITSLATPTVTAPARYDNSSLIVSSAFVNLAIPFVQGFYKNLKISGTPGAAVIAYSADNVVLVRSTFAATFGGLSGSINLASAGVLNSLDTGTLASNTQYYIWAVSDGATFGAVASLSNSAPNAAITGTYPFVAYIGSFRTGTSGIIGFVQAGAWTRYTASATVGLPELGVGDSTGNWQACSVSNSVPPTAAAISVLITGPLNGTSSAGAAPNNLNAFSATKNYPIIFSSSGGFGAMAIWELESSNVYVASTGSTTGTLYCQGYRDNKL